MSDAVPGDDKIDQDFLSLVNKIKLYSSSFKTCFKDHGTMKNLSDPVLHEALQAILLMGQVYIEGLYYVEKYRAHRYAQGTISQVHKRLNKIESQLDLTDDVDA